MIAAWLWVSMSLMSAEDVHLSMPGVAVTVRHGRTRSQHQRDGLGAISGVIVRAAMNRFLEMLTSCAVQMDPA